MVAKKNWPNHAGLRAWRKNRVTGHYVAVYDGEAQGMDTEGGRWQSVCDAHGGIINHETQAQAISAMASVWDWCEECQAEQARPEGCQCPVEWLPEYGKFGVATHKPECPTQKENA